MIVYQKVHSAEDNLKEVWDVSAMEGIQIINVHLVANIYLVMHSVRPSSVYVIIDVNNVFMIKLGQNN